MREKIVKSKKAEVLAKIFMIYKKLINRNLLGNKLKINDIRFVDYGESGCLSSFTEKTKVLEFSSKYLNEETEKLIDSFFWNLSDDYIYRTKKRVRDIYNKKGRKDRERMFNQLVEFNKSNPINFEISPYLVK